MQWVRLVIVIYAFRVNWIESWFDKYQMWSGGTNYALAN